MATLAADSVSHTLTLDYPPELDAIVTRLAAKAGKPKNEYLRRLILDAIEDAEDYMIGEEAWDEHVKSGARTYSLEEVSRRLGLDD